MILAHLAFRSVLRQRRRSLLTVAVLATGFLALALAGGFAQQTFQGLAEGAIRGGLGHVQILNPAALSGDEAQSLEHGLPEGEALAERLRRDPAVAEALPRIAFMGLLTEGARSVAFLGAVRATSSMRKMSLWRRTNSTTASTRPSSTATVRSNTMVTMKVDSSISR